MDKVLVGNIAGPTGPEGPTGPTGPAGSSAARGIDVRDYGADPSGATDSTTGIQDALNATPAGGVCYATAGTYKLSGTIVVPDNVTLQGDESSDFVFGTLFSVADASNLNAVISDSIWSSNGSSNSTAPRVVGIMIDGNSAGQTSGQGLGIAMCSYRGEVLRCRVLNTRGDGVRITDSNSAGTAVGEFCVENKVENNAIKSPGLGNLSNNTEGIAFRDSGASSVTDYWCKENVIYGDPDTNGVGIFASAASGAIISENHLYGTGTHGIYIADGSSAFRIINNYVEYFGQKIDSGVCYGIYAVDGGNGPGTVISDNVVNIDVDVTGNTFEAIHLTNPASGDPAYISLGPNNMSSAVAAAKALVVDNQGDAGNFILAMSPQCVNGFTSPYTMNNYMNLVGEPFAAHQQPTYSATMSVDPTLGTVITIVLGGNLTLDLPVCFPAGMKITFVFQQPDTGGTYNYTVTFASTGGYAGGGNWANASFVAATGASAFSSVEFSSDGYDLVQLDSGSSGGSGTVTSVSVATANGFGGTVATDTTTPAITIKTSVTGLLKGNGTAVSAATSATDYAPATTGTSILKASSGGFANAVSGTDYAPATSGSALLKGNGSGGFSSATSATDYAPATTGTSLLKASSGGFANAVSGTDYAPATTGTSLLKASSGGFANAVSATDYAPATTGTSILKASSGGFANAVANTDYVTPSGSGASLSGITASQVGAIALSLATAVGDMIYGSASGVWTKIAGNTTATKKFWTQTGTGSASAAPGWNALVSGDIPNNAANTTGTAANFAGGATVPAYVAPTVSALTDGSSIAVNAALANDFSVTLGGNRTMAAPSNPVNGQKITFEIAQDATGSRTLAWATGTGAYSFGSGTAPVVSTAAHAVTLVAFRYSAKAANSAGMWCYLGSLGGF